MYEFFSSLQPRPRRRTRTQSARASGFSFIELLVVVAVIGILVALFLPAVQAVREAARRCSCTKNLSQLILAVHNYQNIHGFYPPGTIESQGPIRNTAQGYHHNWIVQILPFLEERNAWSAVDRRAGVYDPANAPVANLRLKFLECPSQLKTLTPQSSYAGVHHDVEAPIDADNHGVFFLNSRIRYEDVTDGSAHTIFLGEMVPEIGGLGWMSGTRATLRNASFGVKMPGLGARGALTSDEAIEAIAEELRDPKPKKPAADRLLMVGGFGSFHPGGAQVAMGDGSVQFQSATIHIRAFRLLAHRSDGKLLDSPF